MSGHRFDDIFAGLTRAAELLAEAGQLQGRAMSELAAVAHAALDTHEEHDDLRETVARLEALVHELLRRQNGGQS